MKRDLIDFHVVEPHQRAVDGRLVNWARWCNGAWGAPSSSPMFRLYRSQARAREQGGALACGGDMVDSGDAAQMAKAVAALPERHRLALSWHYVRPVSPRRAASEIGVSIPDLAQLVRNGRQMLINRGC